MVLLTVFGLNGGLASVAKALGITVALRGNPVAGSMSLMLGALIVGSDEIAATNGNELQMLSAMLVKV